jgi:ribosomal protein S18 acetylase RimI-like enzyme
MDNVVEMPRLTVRPGVAEDADRIAALVHGLWHDIYAPHLAREVGEERTEAVVRAEVEPRLDRAWVAWLGDRLVGYCAVSANCIEDLWVAARHQRRGIGSRLMAAALADLREHGYQSVQAGCEDFNAPACAFLEHHGWRVIGTEPQHRAPSGRLVRALVYSREITAGSASTA